MHIRALFPLAALLATAACDGSPSTPPPEPRPLSSYQLAVLRPQSTGRADIVLMNADGTGTVALTTTPEAESHPSWSPDGRRLVFVRRTEPSIYDFWTMGADGSGATQITFPAEHPGERMLYPAWSPDGATIAYVHENRLFLMDADGRHRRPVTTEPTGTVIWVSWSPDGRRLAFERIEPSPGFRFQIATIGADGSGFRVVSPAGASDSEPVWSPDGTRLLFSTLSGDGRWVLAVMNADGTGRSVLTAPPTRHQITPNWSRDGLWISYVAYEEGVGGEAFVLRPDGTGARSLGPSNIGPVAWRP